MNITYARCGFSLSLLLIAMLSGCASTSKVHVDQDSKVSFANYRSYGWTEPAAVEGETAPALTLDAQRVRAAVGAVLQAKGYVPDQDHPDVRISYVLKVYERPKQSGMSIGMGAGGGSGGVGGGLGVSLPLGKRVETAASLTVNVIDAARHEQVWVGASEVVLKNKDKVAADADVQKLVDEIMVKYPASGK